MHGLASVTTRDGREAGDLALRTLIGGIASGIRATDLVGRLGGLSFAVALWACDEANAARRLEALRDDILEAAAEDDPVRRLTFAAGVADSTHGYRRMLMRADALLERARSEGDAVILTAR